MCEYSGLNLLAVRGYGEAEFWLSGGKVILIFILFLFTFITMVGGSPTGHAYGFYYWQKPGAFAEHISTGSLGRFEGFLAALWNAGFSVVGPEYISIVSAEAKRPLTYLKTAFKTVYFRFALFFIGSAVCVGIVVPYNDDKLQAVASGEKGSSTAAASPYVMAMGNLGITVLPDIVNVLLLTSIFSAGNTYTYCATRSLYGLALEGRAPAILRKTWSNGVPFYCFCFVMIFPLLSLLQCGSASADVIIWFSTLVTGGGIINFIVMSVTYIFWYRACKAQGFDRTKLPYVGRFQPYGAYIALTIQTLMVIFYGYGAFKPTFNVETFFKSYTMQLVMPVLFIGWKLIKRTRFVRPHEADLVWEAPTIDHYESKFRHDPPGFWTEMGWLIGIGRKTMHPDD